MGDDIGTLPNLSSDRNTKSSTFECGVWVRQSFRHSESPGCSATLPLLAAVFAIRDVWYRRGLLLAAILAATVLQTYWIHGERLHLSVIYYIQFFLVGLILADLYLARKNEGDCEKSQRLREPRRPAEQAQHAPPRAQTRQEFRDAPATAIAPLRHRTAGPSPAFRARSCTPLRFRRHKTQPAIRSRRSRLRRRLGP